VCVCVCVGGCEVWEALVTLFFFPVCVLMAWIADRRLLFYKYLHKRYRADKRHGIIVEMEGELAPRGIDAIMADKYQNSTTINMEKNQEPEKEREEVRGQNKTDSMVKYLCRLIANLYICQFFFKYFLKYTSVQNVGLFGQDYVFLE